MKLGIHFVTQLNSTKKTVFPYFLQFSLADLDEIFQKMVKAPKADMLKGEQNHNRRATTFHL